MFKDIYNYEGLYKINEYGDVYSIISGKLKIPQISKDGYYTVQLWKNETAKRFKVHRLVALTFLPNPLNLPIVMHKDNNKLNPHLSNLKWGTLSENTIQAYKDNLMHYPKTHIPYIAYQIYNGNNSVRVMGYDSIINEIGYGTTGTVSSMIKRNSVISKGAYKGYRVRKVERHCSPFIIDK